VRHDDVCRRGWIRRFAGAWRASTRGDQSACASLPFRWRGGRAIGRGLPARDCACVWAGMSWGRVWRSVFNQWQPTSMPSAPCSSWSARMRKRRKRPSTAHPERDSRSPRGWLQRCRRRWMQLGAPPVVAVLMLGQQGKRLIKTCAWAEQAPRVSYSTRPTRDSRRLAPLDPPRSRA
jgi:hypothetical protein